LKIPTDPHEEFRVEDRRHSARSGEEPETDAAREPPETSVVGEFRRRAEQAEEKLRDYIAAFQQHRQEQEEFRARIAADVERRAEARFGSLIEGLLGVFDDLDLALAHAAELPAAAPLLQGLTLARERFLAALAQQGVSAISELTGPFDPNVAEAVRLDPVTSAELDGAVTEMLSTGFRLGDRLIRPARVAVGRRIAPGDQPSGRAT
jgi:molecular chaperone GrpE